jgi:hypothetical protein
MGRVVCLEIIRAATTTSPSKLRVVSCSSMSFVPLLSGSFPKETKLEKLPLVYDEFRLFLVYPLCLLSYL